MPRTRRAFSATFKAQAVLELLTGTTSQAELCRTHNVKPQLLSYWKSAVLDRLHTLFENEQDAQDPGRASCRARVVDVLPGRRHRSRFCASACIHCRRPGDCRCHPAVRHVAGETPAPPPRWPVAAFAEHHGERANRGERALRLLAQVNDFEINMATDWISNVESRSLVHGVSFQPSLGPLMKSTETTSRIRHLFPLSYNTTFENSSLSDYQDFNDVLRQMTRFLDDVYNLKRIHSALGYLTPLEFEEQWRAERAGCTTTT